MPSKRRDAFWVAQGLVGALTELQGYRNIDAMSTAEMNRATLISLVRHLTRDGSARRIREQASLSLGDVGRALGNVQASTVMRWERGEHLPRGDTAMKYGELLAALAALDEPRDTCGEDGE